MPVHVDVQSYRHSKHSSVLTLIPIKHLITLWPATKLFARLWYYGLNRDEKLIPFCLLFVTAKKTKTIKKLKAYHFFLMWKKFKSIVQRCVAFAWRFKQYPWQSLNPFDPFFQLIKVNIFVTWTRVKRTFSRNKSPKRIKTHRLKNNQWKTIRRKGWVTSL